jgi:alpha-tubulin suppressor-like RCC1 family protein
MCKDENEQPFLNKVIDIICSRSHTIAVTSSGHAFSWGSNSYGALGLGFNLISVNKPTLIESLVIQNAHITKVSSNHNHTLFLS